MPILVRQAIPFIDPPAPYTPRVGLQMTWQGCDGSTWQILAPSSRAVLEAGDLRGLGMPDWDVWTSSAPGLAGSRHRGSRAREREAFWPILVTGSSPDEFADWDRAFWRSVDPDREGVWSVTSRHGTRRLRLRLRDVKQVMGTDPLLAQAQSYGVYFAACQPFWEADPVARTWIADSPQPFYMASSGVFYISPSNTLGSATIDNPGDEPAWPVWVITGPCTSASVTVDGQTITAPIALSSSQTLTIDTRPDWQTVTDWTGADRVADLGAVAFGRIPAGASVPIGITATGTASGFQVSASITPLYRRAW